MAILVCLLGLVGCGGKRGDGGTDAAPDLGAVEARAEVCQPSCDGKECGDDGCGGSCGTCWRCQSVEFCPEEPYEDPELCVDGKCEGACCLTWDCCKKECGDDGCGGSCGECPEDTKCIDHSCVPDCVPQCDDWNVCGDDGCGGSCGECAEGDECISDLDDHLICCATCATACAQAGVECGDKPWDWCSPSDAGEIGCNCGDCASGEVCATASDWEVDIHAFCVPESEACAPEGKPGYYYVCADDEACAEQGCIPCSNACAGKECGDDGCGRSCGECPGPQDLCQEGKCVCKPACDDWNGCGDDGCGGECCDDGVDCTQDLCIGGNCKHLKESPDCCVDDAECDDGIDCTLDSCLSEVCVSVPNPKSPLCCIDDSDCDGLGLPYQKFQCVDNLCTVPCQEQGSDDWCYDGNECTLDKWIPSLCKCHSLPPMIAPEGTAFPAACCPDGSNCDDGDPATVDTCTAEDGLCVYCTPDCTGKTCGDDSCGGSCGECPVTCTSHDQCGADQLCLGGAEEWVPATQVCGLCGVQETCQCGTPTWPAQYACTTDADCEKNLMCGAKCDDCPDCPKCVHGWCAYQTGEDVMCLCTGCA